MKLWLKPIASGYAYSDPNQLMSSEQPGGLPRTRIDALGTPGIVNVAWRCDPVQFEYLRDFYREVSAYGSNQFEIELSIDSMQPVLHNVKFLPGSLKDEWVSGGLYQVTAQLFVVPNQPLYSGDLAVLVDAFDGEFGVIMGYLDQFNHLVNIQGLIHE